MAVRWVVALVLLSMVGCSYTDLRLSEVQGAGDSVVPGDAGGDSSALPDGDGTCAGPASVLCSDGDYFADDPCADELTLIERCFGNPCTAAGCLYPEWFGIGGSALTPWGQRVWWGSASGAGITGSTGGVEDPDLVIDSVGRPVVAWTQAVGPSGSMAIYLLRLDEGAWVELDGSASGEGISGIGIVGNARLAVTLDEIVVVYEHSDDGDAQIFARQWNGAAWKDVGINSRVGSGITAGPDWSRSPDVVVSPSGEVVVAFVEDRGESDTDIYVRAFDGSQWRDLGYDGSSSGGVSTDLTDSTSPVLAATGDAADEALWLAWADSADGGNILVSRYDGSAWELVPGGGIPATASMPSIQPSITVDASGAPTVAWQEGMSTASEIHVRRLVDGDWLELSNSATGGGISNTVPASQAPQLVSYGGTPLVVWTEGVGNTSLAARGWVEEDGWLALAGSDPDALITAPTLVSSAPALAAGAGAAWLAWRADEYQHGAQIFVTRWDGAWAQATEPTVDGTGLRRDALAARDVSIAFDPGGLPIAAWTQETASFLQIYVARFDGIAWAQVGAGSMEGRGVSQTSGDATHPDLAVDSLGRITVVWTDLSNSSSEIYGRRFEAGVWHQLDTSASGGGISDSGRSSDSARVTTGPTGAPLVVWRDSSSGVMQVYLRTFDGSGWAQLGGSATGGGISSATTPMGGPDVVTLADGSTVVAWAHSDSGVLSAQYSKGAWSDLDVVTSQPLNAVSTVRLAVDEAGRVVAAWTSYATGRGAIHLKRRDGDDWVELGDSATGDGIGDSQFKVAGNFALALTRDGDPVLSWSQALAGINGRARPEIYALRHFEGTWIPLTVGSASGGGISDSSVSSRAPSMAFSTALICVAWQESMPDTPGLAMRCTKRP